MIGTFFFILLKIFAKTINNHYYDSVLFIRIYNMATMNISLPQSLKDYAQEKTETGEYSNPSDYVRSLIRHDKSRQNAQMRIESLLLEGMESNEQIQVTPEYWKAKKARLLASVNNQ